MDARRFKEWSETFTKDGVFGTRSGRAAIYESILGGELARHPELQRKHAVVSAVIDVSGDSATSASNLVMYDRWSDSPWTIRLGRYTDRLDRRDGRWLFTERRQEWIDLSAGD